MKKFLLGLLVFIGHYSISMAQCTISNATACACADGVSTNCDLLPDLKVGEAPLLVSGSSGVIEYSQTGNGVENGRLRVSVTTPNIGYGPLTVRTTTTYVCGTDTFYGTSPGVCANGDAPKQLINQRVYHKNGNTMTYYDRPAGTMTYHPTHGHMHVDDWGIYTLRSQDPNDPNPLNWPIIGTGSKLAFCLMDYGSCSTYNGHCVDANNNVLTNSNFPNYGLGGGSYNCSASEQGISSGWTDIYYQYLDGMYLDIPPGTCNGDYWIVVHIDPYNYFLESDETNNVIAVPYTLTNQVPAGTNASVTAIGPTTICLGETTTLSANTGSSYLWSSGQTTQTIQVSASGNYSVSVTTPCGTATSQGVQVDVTASATPVGSGASVCAPGGVASISASGSGNINWYDAPVNGNLLSTGMTYTTPFINANTTYYAENEETVSGPVQFATPHSNAIGGGANHTDLTRYLTFDAHAAFTLESVKVYALGTSNRIIELRDASNTILQSVTVNVPAGESRINLGFNVAIGSNYRLGVGSVPDLYRNNAGVTFPYSIPGYLDITGSSAGAGFYYFFYDWEVKGLDYVCFSLREPVTVVLDPCTNIDENSTVFDLQVYPNPAKDLVNVSLNIPVKTTAEIFILDLSGKTIRHSELQGNGKTVKQAIDIAGLSKGIYFVKVIVNGKELNKKISIQ